MRLPRRSTPRNDSEEMKLPRRSTPRNDTKNPMRLLRFARNDSEEEKVLVRADKNGDSHLNKNGDSPYKEKGQSPFLQSPFSEEERILRRIPLEILALSFLTALASLLFFSPLTSVFIFAGGAFSALSFAWLKKSVSKLFLLEQKGEITSKEKGEKKGDGSLNKNGDRPYIEKGLSPFFPFLKKALRSGLALYGLRLLLILAIFFIIILLFSKKIIAFAAGFSVIIPVFLVEAVIALSRMKQWKS
jgi:hypothetical protein